MSVGINRVSGSIFRSRAFVANRHRNVYIVKAVYELAMFDLLPTRLMVALSGSHKLTGGRFCIPSKRALLYL
jgi:hypothetical protein